MDDRSPAYPYADGGDMYARCIVCDGGSLHPLDRYQEAHLVVCERCGLTFAGRRPSDIELDSHYGAYGDWPDSEITRRRYRALLERFEPYRSSGRIFDMGCGPGYFLEEAALRGWSPFGSNVGERSLAICREKGLEVISAPVAPEAFPEGHFDVVTAFEVVEHLRDPMQEAQTLARLLRPGGLLFCTTPNFGSLSRRLLGAGWRVIDYPEHLVYFTAVTLSGWLRRAGFRRIETTTTGISPSSLLGAIPAPLRRPAVRGQTAGPELNIDQRIRVAAESRRTLKAVKRVANRSLTLTGTGDTLSGWFVRL